MARDVAYIGNDITHRRYLSRMLTPRSDRCRELDGHTDLAKPFEPAFEIGWILER